MPASGASTTRLAISTPPIVQLSPRVRATAFHGTNQRQMELGPFIEPWAETVLEQVPGIQLFDAHTHLGQNDPDGMSQAPEQLISTLGLARGAFVFPMHEPDGYPPAN